MRLGGVALAAILGMPLDVAGWPSSPGSVTDGVRAQQHLASVGGVAPNDARPAPRPSGPRGPGDPFAAFDESGAPVRVDRFECHQLVLLPVGRRGPVREPYPDAWFETGEPYHGRGVLHLQSDMTYPRGPPRFPLLFIRAHSGQRVSAPVILPSRAAQATRRAASPLYRFVFYRDPGLPPRLVRAPEYRVLKEQQAARRVRAAVVELSVDFEDPEGEDLSTYWVVRFGEVVPSLFAETVEARLPIGKQENMVMACDPRGNCTWEYLTVELRPEDGPPDAVAIPSKPPRSGTRKQGKKRRP